MNQRREAKDSLDFFPTPPWAARALCRFLMTHYNERLDRLNVWEPACGEHDLARGLQDYFNRVILSDVAPYAGGHDVVDFLFPNDYRAHWIITNPPYRLALEFALTALRKTSNVALLVRTTWLAGQERAAVLFGPTPPICVLQFSERVPMFRGRLDEDGSSATDYCWVIWRAMDSRQQTELHWLPPCRATLEHKGDYPSKSSNILPPSSLPLFGEFAS